MKIGEMDIGALKEVLAEWLEATRGLEIPVGLEIEEALERARELMPLILAGAILPGQVRLDEEFKDVLYGLVSLATRSHEGSSLEIQAVYRFIRGIEWPDDTFDEKGDLLRECRTAAREKIFQEAFSEGSKGSLTIFPEPGRRLPLQESESDAGAASPDESPRRVFERARDLVHAVLVEHRQLAEPEARELEEDLLTWFVRFCSRPSRPTNLRTVLLAACGQFAREYERFANATSDRPAD